MLNNFGMIFGTICLVLGALLLYDGVSMRETTQPLSVIGGALLISLGTVTTGLTLRNKMEWRRNYKKDRD